MLDIIAQIPTEINALDIVARVALSSATSGVSSSSDGKSTIHLLDDSQANQDIANDILNNYDTLVVTADKTTMDEGDVDPVVTCNDASISGDSDVGYVVLLDGTVYASGTTPVTAGVATLNLMSPVDGVYEISMYRVTDNYASGSVTITVNEV